VTGTVEGASTDDRLTGTLAGNITGPMDGRITGDINGTYDSENGSFDGEFEGTVNGTTEQVSPTGGLALVGLLAAFLVAFPIAGYLIERQNPDGE